MYELRRYTRLHSAGDARPSKLYGGRRCMVVGCCGLLSTNRPTSICHFRGLDPVSLRPERLPEPCFGYIDGILYRLHTCGYAPAARHKVEHTTNFEP